MNVLQGTCRSYLSVPYEAFIQSCGFANSIWRAQIPTDVLEKLDLTKPLANSVNLYSRHISLSTGAYDWPSTIKEDKSYGPDQQDQHPRFRLSQFAVDWAALLKPNKHVLYTKSSHSSELPCLHIYPDNLKVTFRSRYPRLAQIEEFIAHLSSPTFPSLPFATIEHLAPRTVHIYICTHNTRDRRCGVLGQLVVTRMREYLASSPSRGLQVEVFGCSHVGGHKFAGNMVIYRPEWRQGIWYGRICPKDIEIVFKETVYKGRILGSHWRGGLPDGTWDPKLGLTAEDVERLSSSSRESASSECSCLTANIGC